MRAKIEELEANSKIHRISRRWDVGMWTGLGWPRIGTGGGRL